MALAIAMGQRSTRISTAKAAGLVCAFCKKAAWYATAATAPPYRCGTGAASLPFFTGARWCRVLPSALPRQQRRQRCFARLLLPRRLAVGASALRTNTLQFCAILPRKRYAGALAKGRNKNAALFSGATKATTLCFIARLCLKYGKCRGFKMARWL
ncbi:hypothetical protein NPIL_660851 [Nephila pilipes]|uniref:Uncharacterized protein n=1 Tax=Nephila pilipes TaxID=299642 RepID=A0A8X6UBZ1_NEPPI|nr:hypothetical protein NPIL_660851 [Nephila pilipes]